MAHTRWSTMAHRWEDVKAELELGENWLVNIMASQHEFQASMNTDPDDMSPEELIQYVMMNILALQDELFEALGETRWKPWARGEKTITDPQKFGGELIDALHFLVNLFLAGGWTAEDVHRAFMAKQLVNRERQRAGYDAKTSKCAYVECQRALDEPGKSSITRVGHADLGWCNEGCYDAWKVTQ